MMARRRRRSANDSIPADEDRDLFVCTRQPDPAIWNDPPWGPFEDEAEARRYWQQHRERLLSDGPTGFGFRHRPWGWWQWEASERPDERPSDVPEDLCPEAADLWALEELTEEDRAECFGPSPAEIERRALEAEDY